MSLLNLADAIFLPIYLVSPLTKLAMNSMGLLC